MITICRYVLVSRVNINNEAPPEPGRGSREALPTGWVSSNMQALLKMSSKIIWDFLIVAQDHPSLMIWCPRLSEPFMLYEFLCCWMLILLWRAPPPSPSGPAPAIKDAYRSARENPLRIYRDSPIILLIILKSDRIYNDPRDLWLPSVKGQWSEWFLSTFYFLPACIAITKPVLGFSMSPVIQRPWPPTSEGPGHIMVFYHLHHLH